MVQEIEKVIDCRSLPFTHSKFTIMEKLNNAIGKCAKYVAKSTLSFFGSRKGTLIKRPDLHSYKVYFMF